MVTVISYDMTVLTQRSQSVFFLMKSINAVRVLTPLSHHSVQVLQMFQRQDLFAPVSFFITVETSPHVFILTSEIVTIFTDGKL